MDIRRILEEDLPIPLGIDKNCATRTSLLPWLDRLEKPIQMIIIISQITPLILLGLASQETNGPGDAG